MDEQIIHDSNNEIELTLTEDFYYKLNALTIDPKIDLEKLRYMSIVESSKKRYGIFWFKDIYTRGGRYLAKAQLMFPVVESRKVANAILDGLAAKLIADGLPIKR
ncbi:MAG: hypothetical protein RR595_05690 [Lysinibacillus sp.]